MNYKIEHGTLWSKIWKPMVFMAVLLMSTKGISQKNFSTLLAGTWELDFNRTMQALGTDKLSTLSKMTPERAERIKNLYANRVTIFLPNGIYEVRHGSGERFTATWSDIGSGQIKLTSAKGRVKTLRVLELNEGALVTGTESGNTFFENLYYTRIPNKRNQ